MPLNAEIAQYNAQLDEYCQSHWGITVKVYKIIKAMTQLAGAGAGIYAMSLGADPMTAFALITVILAGPEAFEYVVTNSDSG